MTYLFWLVVWFPIAEYGLYEDVKGFETYNECLAAAVVGAAQAGAEQGQQGIIAYCPQSLEARDNLLTHLVSKSGN